MKHCKWCNRKLQSKARVDKQFCTDACRSKAHKNVLKCSSCGLEHLSVTLAESTCAPCRLFDLIQLERQEYAAIVAWTYEKEICFYCGEPSTEVEHVIPKHTGLPTWTVHSCRECNSLASGTIYSSVTEKLCSIREKRQRKYKWLYDMPEWSKDELEELGYNLRVAVQRQMVAKQCVQSQLDWNPLLQHLLG